MHRADEHDAQVHPEVEDVEDLRVGKDEHDDAEKVCDVDAGEENVAELDDGLSGSLDPAGLVADGVGTEDVTGELDADPARHDKVDQGDGVEGDVPPVHQSEQVYDDQDDEEDCHHRGLEIEASQDEGDSKHRSQWYGQGADGVFNHGQVLFIENVKYGVRKDIDAISWRIVVIDHQG